MRVSARARARAHTHTHTHTHMHTRARERGGLYNHAFTTHTETHAGTHAHTNTHTHTHTHRPQLNPVHTFVQQQKYKFINLSGNGKEKNTHIQAVTEQRLLGLVGNQDVHLDFHTPPEVWVGMCDNGRFKTLATKRVLFKS